ncbi:SusC/RagA family TonB-linked outer membrane protein [Portibacter marinus]|uniref:SusC/RagA family TonB-linked outer membrane protein n=1 Tax=Portibacter marinus TaxID=2898660 RepID=UPI001F380A05|nr:TonB-dependent receptor [Portibacter marinus]
MKAILQIVGVSILLMFQGLQAQHIVNGFITDESEEPMIGATITEKGTTKGTITDINGEFTLEVSSSDAVLNVSFLGYNTKEVMVDGRSDIDITLEYSASELEEVVVVGYGTQQKKDITGSIETISSQEITERNVTNVSNALQGAVAGLVVTRSGSAPGSGNTLRIRGNTTLQGSNDPLVLIDDIPGNINDVTPDQIESIAVLKDGAAAAVYGSRAAAGVIIITTKRAKSGQFNINYSGDYFINTPTQRREYVNALTYMQMDNEKSWNDNGNGDNEFPIWSEETINKYVDGSAADNRDLYPDTDWAGLILKQNSMGHRHNINMTGGTDRVKSNAFFGYEFQDALYNYRDWQRYTTRINNDLQLTDKIGAIADINFKFTKENNPIVNPIQLALQAAPVYPAVWEDGRYAEGKSGDNIYLRYNEGGFSKSNSYLFTGRMGLFYKPIDNLKISFNLTPTATFTDGKTFSKEVRYWNSDDPDQIQEGTLIPGQTQNALQESRYQFTALMKQGLVNYDKSFSNHNLNVLGGAEERSSTTEVLGVRGQNFESADFPFLNQAPTAEVFNNGTGISEVAYRSVFGRLNYNFDDRYFLGAAVRRDGSSRFGTEHRWGTFPSVSAAWTISNEPFFENLLKPLSHLKLKGSYGTLGNDRLGNYLYITQLQIQNILLANGVNTEEARALSQLYLTTPDIRWETTVTKNAGIEIGLFDYRFSLQAEYFVKETKDMLLSLSVPDLVGFEDPTVNVGSMTTTGWDLSTNWQDEFSNGLRYGISFNISDARSIIGDINGKRLFSGVTLSEEGSEFQELYGLKSDGLYQDAGSVEGTPVTSAAVGAGDVRYQDISGPDDVPDGVINDFDRVFLGSSLPRLNYGGRLFANFKGIDLSCAFQGVGKRNLFLSQSYIRPFIASWLSPNKEYASSYWSEYNSTEENANAKYPRLSETAAGNNYRFSDFWLRNGAYFRVKNISIGYTIPQTLVNYSGLSGLRINLSGNDLFTFDMLPDGIDPEQTSGVGYFITSSYLVGVRAKF